MASWGMLKVSAIYTEYIIQYIYDMRGTYLVGALPAAYMSSPCHIELVLSEKDSTVKAEPVSPQPESVLILTHVLLAS